MNIFNSFKKYPTGWREVARRNFTQEEQDAVESVKVVESNYGFSACFVMRSGGAAFIPMANDVDVAVGDAIDISKAELVTLRREGNEDIFRVSI